MLITTTILYYSFFFTLSVSFSSPLSSGLPWMCRLIQQLAHSPIPAAPADIVFDLVMPGLATSRNKGGAAHLPAQQVP